MKRKFILIFFCCLILLPLNSAFSMSAEQQMLGIWQRFGDSFDGAVMEVKKIDGMMIGQYVEVTPVMKDDFQFYQGDVKWKDIRLLRENEYYVKTLVKKRDGSKAYDEAIIRLSNDIAVVQYFSQYREGQSQKWKKIEAPEIQIEPGTDMEKFRDSLNQIQAQLNEIRKMVMILWRRENGEENYSGSENLMPEDEMMSRMKSLEREIAKLRAEIDDFNYGGDSQTFSPEEQEIDGGEGSTNEAGTGSPELEELQRENEKLKTQVEMLEQKVNAMAQEMSRPKYSKEEFDVMFQEQTREYVIKELGSPDRIDKSSDQSEYWFYHKAVVYDPLTKFVFSRIIFTFENDRVASINVY